MAPKKTKHAARSRKKFRWDTFITELASKFGVKRTAILCTIGLFLIQGTSQQHEEFIDRFILLKFEKGNIENIAITSLALIIVAQTLLFSRELRVKDERIKELVKEKNTLLDKLLKQCC